MKNKNEIEYQKWQQRIDEGFPKSELPEQEPIFIPAIICNSGSVTQVTNEKQKSYDRLIKQLMQ